MGVKKICLYGTESTGKSTLTIMLAEYYQTEYVPEMARNIINDTENCTVADLLQVAHLHACEIQNKLKTANRFLFIDTDLRITRSYSKFLFGQSIEVPYWIEEANAMDLYLYLEKDVPFIQDGTRLAEKRRNELDYFHHLELQVQDTPFELISGTWEERFQKAVIKIENNFPYD